MTLSRRETLQWMMTAAALPLARWTPPAMAAGQGTPRRSPSRTGRPRCPRRRSACGLWPRSGPHGAQGAVAADAQQGAARDDRPAGRPDPSCRRTVAGAGKLGVGAFVDEWIRRALSEQAEGSRAGARRIDLARRAEPGAAQGAFDAITPAHAPGCVDARTRRLPVAGMAKPMRSWTRCATSSCSASTACPGRQGGLGYIGDQPTPGDYPGPTPESVRHFGGRTRRLGLPGS